MSGLVGYLNNPVTIVAGADAPTLKEWTFDTSGNIVLPQGGDILNYLGTSLLGFEANSGNITFDNDTIGNSIQGNSVLIQTADPGSTTYSWSFGADGTFLIPAEGNITQSLSITRSNVAEITTATPTVIWSSISSIISSAKLLIQLEQEQVGDLTGLHTHSCEAIISARGTVQTDIPAMSVYGVNYTYTSSLVTFTIQRNISTGIVEVVATLVDTTNPAYLSVHSIEQSTRGLFII